MTHYLPRAEVQRTSHIEACDCPCKPTMRLVFNRAPLVGFILSRGPWSWSEKLVYDHHVI